MSDEPTGDSKRPENNHRPPNNRTTPAPNCSSEPEIIPPSLSAKFRVVRGLKNDHSALDGEKDGISSPASPNFCSEDPHSSGGGRLKFFKDGKFILELSHRKDGEKTCWIPVPKKTFWPVIGSPKQESSASLSVSDDNSSIQSSPWQRDHCWKQATPRSNISKQKEFFFVSHKRTNGTSLRSKCLRRKPFVSTISKETANEKALPKARRLPLGRILQSLWERVMTTAVKPDFGIVSPRKRILRELERFTLEEATKRQRARAPLRSSHSISSILAKEGESVLRTLLRSPSPEGARPPLVVTTSSSTSSTSTYHPPTSHNVSTTNAFLGNSSSYYSPVTAAYPPHLWPVHDPFSSPPIPLPLYYIPSYTQSWPQVHRSVPSESSSDVPLNLSKNPG